MSAQSNRDSDYITQVRSINRQLWDAINNLVECQQQWTALDYTNTLPDGEGTNSGITKAQVSAVVNTTADAFVALLAQGHGTNMASLL